MPEVTTSSNEYGNTLVSVHPYPENLNHFTFHHVHHMTDESGCVTSALVSVVCPMSEHADGTAENYALEALASLNL